MLSRKIIFLLIERENEIWIVFKKIFDDNERIVSSETDGCHDNRHNDTRNNDNQQKWKNAKLGKIFLFSCWVLSSVIMLDFVMLRFTMLSAVTLNSSSWVILCWVLFCWGVIMLIATVPNVAKNSISLLNAVLLKCRYSECRGATEMGASVLENFQWAFQLKLCLLPPTYCRQTFWRFRRRLTGSEEKLANQGRIKITTPHVQVVQTIAIFDGIIWSCINMTVACSAANAYSK